MRTRSTPGLSLAFVITILSSAFLLFAVQPLIAKFFLPWFGGAAAVWTTCLLFFQVFLLAGYAYAHFIATRFGWKAQKVLHLLLLLCSIALLIYLSFIWSSPITPGGAWKPSAAGDPTSQVLVLLGISIGMPYFMLSTTSPLLQSWLGRAHSDSHPYRLYAVSNLGSLVALISYPFLIEPALSLRAQARIWSSLYILFALSCSYCALRLNVSPALDSPDQASSSATKLNDPPPEIASRPGKGAHLLWFSLPACGSVMLLATTNRLCQEIAVIPFLWVLPLALYLLSFIICFDKERWYSRKWFHPALGVALFMACFFLYRGPRSSAAAQIGIYSFTLFAVCMVCHGELVRLKPRVRYLTDFYLSVAGGGAAGGVFVALIAPHLFKGFWEYHLGLWASALLVFIVLIRDRDSWLHHNRLATPYLVVAFAVLLPQSIVLAKDSRALLHNWSNFVVIGIAIALMVRVWMRREKPASDRAQLRFAKFCAIAALAVLGGVLYVNTRRHLIAVYRNFYGVISVEDTDPNDANWHAYTLRNGPVVHGFQFLSASKRRLPTAYYDERSGVGLALLSLRREMASSGDQSSLRVGVVGLGVGTIAAYGRPGDYLRFYEINPAVIRLSEDGLFTYLKDCPARVDVVLGDARISMERELATDHPQRFDLLAVDAFSAEAIPTHLLTTEAFKIYLRQLSPHGILAFHISNRFLDLGPVVWEAGEHFGLTGAFVNSGEGGLAHSPSLWVLLRRGSKPFDLHAPGDVIITKDSHLARIRLWTDDYSNLFQILKW